MVKSECFGKKGTTLGISKYGQKQLKQRGILRARDCSQQQAWHVKYKQARRPVQATGA